MNGRLARWLELPPGERWLLLGLMLGLPAASISLRVFGFVRTRSWLESSSSGRTIRAATTEDIRSAERIARLAEIAGRRGAVTATCLRQSLLVYWLLRRRNLLPELKIGVRKEKVVFDAHAWVELQGVALGQTNLVHAPFPDREWSESAPLL
jgi:hypothetical protein